MSHQRNKPTISVAIATFNGASYISDQIQSILSQTVLPIEIIICDDLSDDSTTEIINTIISQSNVPIYFQINPKNLGYVKNFEQAISLCKGDIIVLSDQDNIWFPERLEQYQKEFSSGPNIGLVIGDAIVVDEHINSFGFMLYSKYKLPNASPNNVLLDLIKSTWIKGCTIAFLSKYRKYLLPINSDIWGHDHWIVFIMSIISNISIINNPLMFLRRHATTTGSDPRIDLSLIGRVQNKILKLNTHHYRQDCRRWYDMVKQLEKIEGMIKFLQIDIRNLWPNRFELVKKRAIFSEIRLELTSLRKVLRFPHVIKMYITKQYSENGLGIKSAIRDILA